MNERSFFDFDSQFGDSNHLGSTPWGRRFQDLTRPVVDSAVPDSVLPESVIEGTFDEDNLPTHGEIIELIETLHAGESSPFLPRAMTDRSHSIHLPEHYEAGYAYPLVVWFHGDGSSEAEVASVMPNISERNYIGLALRGNVASGQGFGWLTSGDHLQKLIQDVESLVLAMRRQYHIHSERIYLAGFGSGASAAMELILQKPEWFGGAACFCGLFPELHVPQRGDHELRNKRVLLATSANSRTCKVGDVVAAGRLLYASGMQIGTRVYQEAGSGPSSKMLSDINRWLMDDVCSAIS
jgi:phospholipase/carboxylesterase